MGIHVVEILQADRIVAPVAMFPRSVGQATPEPMHLWEQRSKKNKPLVEIIK